MASLGDTTTLAVNDGASNAFVAVTGIIDFDPPGDSKQLIDVTALDSTAGTRVKMLGTRADPGQWSFRVFQSTTERTRFDGLYSNGTSKSYKITYPDATIDTVTCVVLECKTSKIENQSPVEFMVTVGATSKVART
jgi:hypothetical protein